MDVNELSESVGKEAPRFLILQSNGNVGDYAMLSNMVRRLRTRFPECAIDVLGDHLVDYCELRGVNVHTCGRDHFASGGGRLLRLVERLPKGRRAAALLRCLSVVMAARAKGKWTYRKLWDDDCRELVDLLSGASCIISCGGGYLNSIWWDKELWPKCACYAAGAELGRPVVLSGQGIGPITRRIDSLVLKSGLRRVRWISLRGPGDGESYLEKIGIPRASFGAAGDDAVDLPVCDKESLSEIAAREGIERTLETAVFNVRFSAYSHGSPTAHAALLARLADSLVELYGYQIVFVCLSYEDIGGVDDRTAAFDVTKYMDHRSAARIVMGRYSPEEVKAIVGLGTFGFGMSYHFAVFALTQGMPCFTFYDTEYYRLKCSGLYSQFGEANWFQPLNEEGIVSVLAQVESERDRIDQAKGRLIDHTREMVGRVDKVYDRIGSVLQRA